MQAETSPTALIPGLPNIYNIDPDLEILQIRLSIRRRDEIRQGKVHPIPGKEGIAKVKAMAKK